LTWHLFPFLLPLVSCLACRRAAEPSRLPRPVQPQYDWSGGPDSVFVWTVEAQDSAPAGLGRGADRPPRWKTYRLAREGGAWVPAGVRDGLWMALGNTLAELRWKPFLLEALEPPEKDDPGYAGWPAGCEVVLEADDRRFSATGTSFDLVLDSPEMTVPLLSSPENLSNLGWPRLFRSEARVLATLGPIVFLLSEEVTVTCEGDSYRSGIFTIFDAAKRQVLLSRNLAISGVLNWDTHFDRPHHRDRIRQMIEWSGVAGVPLDEKPQEQSIRAGYYYPVYHLDDQRVNMKLVYHYKGLPCLSCDSPEALSIFTIDWPGELDAYLPLHPAIPALRPHLPRGARIGGVTQPQMVGPVPEDWTARFARLQKNP
jgi:hypothetical protein